MHRAPPSTTRVSPVIHEAASEHRNSAALAMSVGDAEAAQRAGAGDPLLARLPQGLGQLGLDQSRGHGIDPDRRSELAGQLDCQVDDRGLGHVVPTDAALDGHAADGGDVEHDPAVVRHAGPPRGLGPLEVAGLVDPHRLVGPAPVEISMIGPVVRIGGGVVDQDVDPPEPVDGGGHAGLGLVRVPGVGHPPGHLAGPVAELRPVCRRPRRPVPRHCGTRSSPMLRRRRTPGRWPGRCPVTPRSPMPSYRPVEVPCTRD